MAASAVVRTGSLNRILSLVSWYYTAANYEEVFRRLPLMTALDDLQEGSYYKDWLRHWTYDSYVYPDGRAIHICEGIMRASFRESLENPSLIEPGKIHEYRISLWETSTVFKAGHRIRLEVSSSNFPRYARNLNTGYRLGTSAEMETAEQTIHHNARHSSMRTPEGLRGFAVPVERTLV